MRATAAVVAILAATPALAAKKPLAAGDRIDLNRAGVVELMRLPGVGRKRAQAIVTQRSRTPFRSIDDVTSVRGISPAWVEKQRAHLVVVGSPPAPARPPATPARHHE